MIAGGVGKATIGGASPRADAEPSICRDPAESGQRGVSPTAAVAKTPQRNVVPTD